MSLVPLTDADIDWSLSPAPETVPAHPDDLVIDALLDAQAYRTLASAAIHYTHRLRQELEQLRCQHYRLVADYRALRAGASS